MKPLSFTILFLFFSQFCISQKIGIVSDTIQSSFRGLSAVDNNIVWVSGSNGTVGGSVDGGKSWKWMRIKGYEKKDFRDIEAFSKTTAIVMAISEPAYILRTTDGGNSWKIVFEDHTKGMFLDAMDFQNDKSGIVLGDPIGNRFFIARSFDGGKTWKSIPHENRPMADSGEACFASSGTNIRKLHKAKSLFVSGGLSAHLFIGNKKLNIPISQGKQSTGSNSVALKNSKNMIIVGGDFLAKDSTYRNCVITSDGGKSFYFPNTSPSGYRSCVEFLQKNSWITCGLNGVDISNDNGMNWRNISKESFHVCRKSKRGNVIYFAGNNGRIGKLYMP